MTANSSIAPVIVSSENGRQGAEKAMQILRSGGSALEAVEAACRVVEDNPDDHTVGFGGMPNVLGQVELDASIMDGRDLRAGAVGAVHGYGNAITLARHVMEQSPHVLLVDQGAERFAAEMNVRPQEQLTFEALNRWQQRFVEAGLTLTSEPLHVLAARLTGPMGLRDQKDDSTDPAVSYHGTVNFLALDQDGNLASAVSTSGLAWKYPGRIGDSPVIGAGNYCDNRYGAAACTGMGELSMRVCTARSLVLYMKMGMSLHDAGMEALRDLAYLSPPPRQYMNIVALSPTGEHGGFSTVPGKKYLYMTGDMEAPTLEERSVLA
jgi:beta-aspartyl-peptidase (threonine type)